MRLSSGKLLVSLLKVVERTNTSLIPCHKLVKGRRYVRDPSTPKHYGPGKQATQCVSNGNVLHFFQNISAGIDYISPSSQRELPHPVFAPFVFAPPWLACLLCPEPLQSTGLLGRERPANGGGESQARR